MDRYVPSEPEEVHAMLDLAGLKPGELHADLGAGDGRFVVEALKRGARSFGYEWDRELAEKFAAHHGIKIYPKSLFDANLRDVDVVTFWFEDPFASEVFTWARRRMKPGSRILANGEFPHWPRATIHRFDMGQEFDGTPRTGTVTLVVNG